MSRNSNGTGELTAALLSGTTMDFVNRVPEETTMTIDAKSTVFHGERTVGDTVSLNDISVPPDGSAATQSVSKSVSFKICHLMQTLL